MTNTPEVIPEVEVEEDTRRFYGEEDSEWVAGAKQMAHDLFYPSDPGASFDDKVAGDNAKRAAYEAVVAEVGEPHDQASGEAFAAAMIEYKEQQDGAT